MDSSERSCLYENIPLYHSQAFVSSRTCIANRKEFLMEENREHREEGEHREDIPMPFIGQIELFPYNFVPRGWSFCEGQILRIEQYEALYTLLGTRYGGDGSTTFALPNLKGKEPDTTLHYCIACEGYYPPLFLSTEKGDHRPGHAPPGHGRKRSHWL